MKKAKDEPWPETVTVLSAVPLDECIAALNAGRRFVPVRGDGVPRGYGAKRNRV